MVKPSVGLVLGGGKTVHEDIEAALSLGEYDKVIAINDIGKDWEGDLDIWVSLHPDNLIKWWDERLAKSGNKPTFVSHDERDERPFPLGIKTKYRFHCQTKSGSSGLFAVRYSLIEGGLDKLVLCGVPMKKDHAHYFKKDQDWHGAVSHRRGWEEVHHLLIDRVKSMSGWTMDTLGAPTRDWLLEPCRNTEVLR